MSSTTTAEMSTETAVENEQPSPTEIEDVPRLDQRLFFAAIPLVLVALVAAYFYFVQITKGIGLVAGLNRPVFWGLYLVNCIFFVGVSTGGVVIASLVHAFGRTEFKPIARIAELMAISATVMATASLFVNLCWPTRMFYIIRYPHPSSPIFWDMVNITTYMFVSLTYAYLGTRADLARVMHAKPQHAWLYRILTLGYTDLSAESRRRDQRLLRILAVIVLFAELAVQTVSAWLFGLQKAQPGWFGGMMAPLFVIFAIVSGLAVLTVSLVVTKRLIGIAIEHELVRKLGKIVLFLLPVLGYFLFVELVTVLYSAEPARLDVYRAMMFGLYAPMFWGHLVLGLIFPMLLLAVVLYGVSQRTIWLTGIVLLHVFVGLAEWLDFPIPYKPLWPGLQVWAVYTIMGLTGIGLLSFCARASIGEDVRIGIATLLVAAGILAGRWNVVVPSLMDHSYLPYPLTQYIPTLKEFVVFLGIYALGALIYITCLVLLPLLDREEAEIEIVEEERVETSPSLI